MADDAFREVIDEIATALAKTYNSELIALSPEEIANEWHWKWEEDGSIEWNTYRFSDILELQKRRWRQWEEHHNGTVCIVERVRDKYVMPRVQEFLKILISHL